MACFVYGDYDGLWAILEKPWLEYLEHGYTWYCECEITILNEEKSGLMHIRETIDPDINKIKKSIASLIYFFPGFSKFFVRLPEAMEIEQISSFISRKSNNVNFSQFTNKV